MLERTSIQTRVKSPFPRMHLFEFGDLKIPQIFHNLMTDILGHIAKLGLYDAIIPIIYKILQEQKCTTIVDLCTGSGEPAMLLKEKLSKDYQIEAELILTDKFPNVAKANNINKLDGVTYLTESIDATALPKDLKGLRTLFASLHHFKPDQVKAILQDAVDNDQPIAALEFTERTWIRAFFMIPGTLHMLLITPFIKPFSLSRIFWTYGIPVMPIIYLWDGLVSNLRTYNADELQSIINNLDNNHFTWDINTVPTATWPINVTYVIGKPELPQPLIAKLQQKITEEKYEESKESFSYKHLGLGLLMGICSYLALNDSRISIACSAIAAISSWLISNKHVSHYGRFFTRHNMESINESYEVDKEMSAQLK